MHSKYELSFLNKFSINFYYEDGAVHRGFKCSNKWEVFYDRMLIYKSVFPIANCFSETHPIQSRSLEKALNDLLSFIAEKIDFSLLESSWLLLGVFTNLPFLIGELSCDCSYNARKERGERVLDYMFGLEQLDDYSIVLKDLLHNWLLDVIHSKKELVD